MKACPGCQRSLANVLGQCPFCRHVFPASADAQKPTLDPELIAAALAADRSALAGEPRPLQGLLLVLALPVLVPAVLVHGIGKRWGLADVAAIGLSSVLGLVATWGSPVPFGTVVLALVCALALVAVRFHRRDDASLLGYTPSILWTVFCGCLLIALGTWHAFPGEVLWQFAMLNAGEVALSPSAAGEALPHGPRSAVLSPARLDVDHAWTAPAGIPTYAPVEGSAQRLWVLLPHGFPHTMPGELHGVLFPEAMGLPFKVDGPARVLGMMDHDAYLAASGLTARMAKEFSLAGIALACFGGLLLFIGVWVAARE